MAERIPAPSERDYDEPRRSWLLRAVAAPPGDREQEAAAAETRPAAGPAPHSRRESCWLCGLTRSAYDLVPDGGDACADVRWYCQDAQACTGRWLAARQAMRAAGRPGRAGPPGQSVGQAEASYQ